MLPEKVYNDKKAPECGGIPTARDTVEEKRANLRSLILELTDEECNRLWEEWRMTHV